MKAKGSLNYDGDGGLKYFSRRTNKERWDVIFSTSGLKVVVKVWYMVDVGVFDVIHWIDLLMIY